MSDDWRDELNDEQRAEWDAFVEHFRRETIHQIDASAAFLSLIPDRDNWDVNFCVQLGTAILLDKPLLAIVMPGAHVPEKMRLVADEIVEADVDTEDGKAAIAAAVGRMKDRIDAR